MLRTARLFQNLRVSKFANSGVNVVTSRSLASGHGHGHGHGHATVPAGPYDVPHHPTKPDVPGFLGIHPDEPYKYQGFEYIAIGTYIICFGILVFGYSTKDMNSFKVS